MNISVIFSINHCYQYSLDIWVSRKEENFNFLNNNSGKSQPKLTLAIYVWLVEVFYKQKLTIYSAKCTNGIRICARTKFNIYIGRFPFNFFGLFVFFYFTIAEPFSIWAIAIIRKIQKAFLVWKLVSVGHRSSTQWSEIPLEGGW